MERRNVLCAGEDEICFICCVGDDLVDDESCPYDDQKTDDSCTGFQCSQQCRMCPMDCEFLGK